MVGEPESLVYEIRFKKSAKKELRKLPAKEINRILAKIQILSSNPRPPGCEKLSDESGYRVRQGDYRVVYTIDDEGKRVEIQKIGHRREVYR